MNGLALILVILTVVVLFLFFGKKERYASCDNNDERSISEKACNDKWRNCSDRCSPTDITCHLKCEKDYRRCIYQGISYGGNVGGAEQGIGCDLCCAQCLLECSVLPPDSEWSEACKSYCSSSGQCNCKCS